MITERYEEPFRFNQNLRAARRGEVLASFRPRRKETGGGNEEYDLKNKV